MRLGIETAKAFGLAGDKYEGCLKETMTGIYVELTWQRKLKQAMFIEHNNIPIDEFLKDLFLAHHIRKLAEQLGEQIKKENVS